MRGYGFFQPPGYIKGLIPESAIPRISCPTYGRGTGEGNREEYGSSFRKTGAGQYSGAFGGLGVLSISIIKMCIDLISSINGLNH
jgi:hypothetical protein